MMENNVIRLNKIVKIIGIIDIIVFLIMGIFFAVIESAITFIFFLPFVLLGVILVIADKRERIIVEDDRLIFCHIFRKTHQIKYTDIQCLLFVPLNQKSQMIIVDKHYNRIASLEEAFDNIDVLFDKLDEKEIEVVDFGELIEDKKDVSKYLKSLNMIERSYYKSIKDEVNTIETLSYKSKELDITKTRKKLKIIGIIMILFDVMAYFIGGKTMVIIMVLILLITYLIYLIYHPYIYIEISKKDRKQALQLPIVGAIIALLMCLNISIRFNYSFFSGFMITLGIAIVLALPFIIKDLKTKGHLRLIRKLSTILAIFIISYAITFPVNYIMTFGNFNHRSVIITDKYISGGRTRFHYLKANFNGKEVKFCISKDLYNNTSINDIRRVCIRKSALGLEYYTIHK